MIGELSASYDPFTLCIFILLSVLLGTLAVLLIVMPDVPPRYTKSKKKRIPRMVLEAEMQALNERCEELKTENVLLMRENYRLRAMTERKEKR